MNILHCGVFSRAKVHRIVSSKPAYEYQILYHVKKCKACGQEKMWWAGEFQAGHLTARLPIPNSEFAHWAKRAKDERAKPQIQLTSEYSSKISGPIDSQLKYLAKLDRAAKDFPVPLFL